MTPSNERLERTGDNPGRQGRAPVAAAAQRLIAGQHGQETLSMMNMRAYQIVLGLVAGAALIRSIGIIALKGRQIRYRKRAAAKPTGWQDLCTEPEPPLLGIVALVLLGSLPARVPSLGSVILAVLGLGLAVGAWVLIVWAVRSFPAVSPGHYVLPEQQIVTAGPYGYLRNPLYAGALLIWLALAVAFRSSAILGITLLYVLPAYLVYMRSEERMLLAHFGERYARYRENVGMLFPRLASRCTRDSPTTSRDS
jgi:protein-S-isoprenylcysteine O-methyltransferase Ste14